MENHFNICGQVIDASTNTGAYGVRVEAWDKDLLLNDFVGSAITDKNGKFAIAVSQRYYDEVFWDRTPDLFFKVYYNNNLILSTEKNVLWNIHQRDVEVSLSVSIPTLPGSIKPGGSDGNGHGGQDFKVTGKVSGGKTLSNINIIAFDVDLRGASIFDTAQNLSEIQKNQGFELLGKTTTNAAGLFEIPFRNEAFMKSEKGKADVILYALREDRIIGRSNLAHINDYHDKLLENWNISLDGGTKDFSEFELIQKGTDPLLQGLSFTEINASSKMVKFLADESELDFAKITLYVTASAMSEEITFFDKNTSAQLLYGMARGINLNSFSLGWASLASADTGQVIKAIAASIAGNIVQPFKDDFIAEFVNKIHSYALSRTLDNKPDDNQPSPGQVLNLALPDNKELQSTLLSSYINHTGDPEAFWTEVLPSQPGFKDRPDLVQKLQFTNQLSYLTLNHLPLMQELQQRQFTNARDIVRTMELSDVVEIVKKTGVPEGVDGATEDEKVNNYAASVHGALEAAFPTQAVERMVKNQSIPVDDEEARRGLLDFFTQANDFDLANTPVNAYIASNPQILDRLGDNGKVKTVDQLRKLQRAIQVSPDSASMSVLMKNELTSSYRISRLSKEGFIASYGYQFSNPDIAEKVYERASYIQSKNEQVFRTVHQSIYSYSPQVVADKDSLNQSKNAVARAIPNYTQLFGPQDSCKCEECSSVYGAAAYFVDILQFLHNNNLDPSKTKSDPQDLSNTALKLLLNRRPDLQYLQLTCENTNTVLPYIDIVNEIMEYYVYHSGLDNFKGHNVGPDDTSEELDASPQYTITEAYNTLSTQVSPFVLPYNQPLDVIRTYLENMKSSRFEVMKTGMKGIPSGAALAALCAEYLKISSEEYEILTGKKFDGTDSTLIPNLREAYGYTTDNPDSAHPSKDWKDFVSEVPEFLKKTGIKYEDLVAILTTSYVNPNYQYYQFIENLHFDFKKLSDIAATGSLTSSYPDTTDYSGLQQYLNDKGIPTDGYQAWATGLVNHINNIIVLYAPDSVCDLSVTKLQHVNGSTLTGNVLTDDLGRIHRFIRLWKKLGWSIIDTDYALSAFGNDITPECINALMYAAKIKNDLSLAPAIVLAFWAPLQTTGKGNLYAKLFLNKALQKIDDKFTLNDAGNELADTTGKLDEHVKGLMSALKISETDIALIRKDAGLDAASALLNLDSISHIYRYTALAKALGVKIPEFISIKSIVGTDPFEASTAGPSETGVFIEKAQKITSSGFKGFTLDYIINGVSRPGYSDPSDDLIIQTAVSLRDGLTSIENDHLSVTEFSADVLRTKLSLIYDSTVISKTISLIENTGTYTAVCDKALTPAIPSLYKDRVTYNKLTGVVTSLGILTATDIAALLAPANPASFKTALSDIFSQPRKFLADSFNGFLDVNEGDTNNAIKTLIDQPAKDSGGNIVLPQQYNYFLTAFLPFLRTKLGDLLITQNLTENLKLSTETTNLLIGSILKNGSVPLIEDIHRLNTKGLTGYYFNGALGDDALAVLTRIDEEVAFDWQNGSPGAPVNADNFGVRWEGFLSSQVTDDYILFLNVKETDEKVKLWIDGKEQVLYTSDSLSYFTDAITLKAKTLHSIQLEYTEVNANAGVELYWQSPSVPKEIVPKEALYPESIFEDFKKDYIKIYKASLLIQGLKLEAGEIAYLDQYKAEYDNLDFNAFTSLHWERLNDYVTLRNLLSDKNQALVALMAQVKNNPAMSAEDFSLSLNAITGWEETLIQAFTTYYIPVSGFTNEKAFIKSRMAIYVCSKLGINIATLWAWSRPDNVDFYVLNSIAQNVKYAFKGRYEDAQWVKAVKPLNDVLRENQKNALIGYLLVQPQLLQWGVTDANSLFEYFLIDVQMEPVMETSRLVQAIASVQLFVQRCFLNLEKEINPGALSQSRWEWMQDYRVWEANRKVFLYPENWLDPAWRDDKSPFFKELESELLQGDITNENVEDALKSYLFKLDEVARLDVCGMYQEKDSKGNNTLLHVFGRVHHAPYTYYYRTFDNVYGNWSAWDKVPVDINGVDSGPTHGVHLLPVVINQRLYIFWLIFNQKTDTSKNNSSTMQEASNKTQAELASDNYWEINLGWSEYKQGKWTAKKISQKPLIPGFLVRVKGEKAITQIRYPFVESPKAFSLYYSENDRKLIVKKEVHGNVFQDAGYFTFSIDYKDLIPSRQLFEVDKNALAQFFEYLALAGIRDNFNYKDDTEDRVTDFMANDGEGKFKQNKSVILDTPDNQEFELLYTHQDPAVSFFSLNDDFFYKDSERTYFVTPVQAYYMIPILQNPDKTPLSPSISKKAFPEYVLADDILPVPIGPDPVESLSIFKNNSVLDVSEQGKITPVESYGGRNVGTAIPIEVPQVLDRNVELKEMRTADVAELAYSANAYEVATDRISVVEGSFQYASRQAYSWLTIPYTATKFYPFYHPHTNQFIKRMCASGLEAFYAISTQKLGGNAESTTSPDSATKFNTVYKPNPGYVETPYPRENVDFGVEGKTAYSQYNWELYFHVPVMIATKLTANQKFEDAMKWFHYIFNPTTDDPDTSKARYWTFLKFKELSALPAQSLEDYFKSLAPNTPNAQIAEWRDNPFMPHLVARNMPVHYMKYVVMKYIDNLIAWGDQMFRQNTIEANNKAIQLYVLAAHILGPKPNIIPRRGTIQPESYRSLLSKWDAFSNALVELENTFPYSSEITSAPSPVPSGSVLGMGHTLYFSIPQNDTLMGYWDLVDDRLYKIRHGLNIEGIFDLPALFAPPIDPGALINALANGGSLSSVLSDMNSPLPYYRFSYILDKALAMCNDLKGLGSALLSALEKKDGEALSKLRATHETNVLNMTLQVKEQQIEEAQQSFNGLLKTRETNAKKYSHYCELLGISPSIPSWDADTDTQINDDIAVSADDKPVDSDESGVKIIHREKEDFEKTRSAQTWKDVASGMEGLSGLLHLIPDFVVRATPVGVGGGFNFGGSNVGAAVSGAAKGFDIAASEISYQAARASKFATYIRREEEWTLQANLAAKEIKQIDKQLNAANIRIKIATREKENITKQIEQSEKVEQFLKDKYTNQELYEWMKGRISGVYFQSYQLAFDLARKAEKAYRFERNEPVTSFIQFGYWDNLHSGLLSGESLYLALKQMERAHMDTNRRDYEITKNISLLMHDPFALIALKENGSCEVALPEELFDLDYPGHYMRRIKSVSLTIPCITGPYTSINCTLTLLGNKVRVSSSKDPQYPESTEEDDDRFSTSFITTQSIAASQAQNDSGLFELNFRDERFLPFEGAGTVSRWRIELPSEFRQFDYQSISDVIIQLKYTAREGGKVLKDAAVANLQQFVKKAEELNEGEGLYQMFSLKHEFPNEWYRFFNPPSGSGQELKLQNLKLRLPFYTKSPTVTGIDVQSADLFVNGNTVSLKLNGDALSNSEDVGNLKHYVTGNNVPSFNDDWSFVPASGTISKDDMKDAWIVIRYVLNS